MKYLEYTPLDRINHFLSHLNLGERTIKGCLEAYSCKHTGTDKKLSLSLENEILDYLGKSSDTDSSSPVEYLFSRSSRKTLIYLLLTLNHLYPDYDFSAVRAHEFFTEESWDSFKQIFDVYMFEASKEWLKDNEGVSLLETLYKALDEVVKLAECEIYCYNPEAEADPFLEKGAIWSYHFFFYNRKLKRVVSFRFSCISNLAGEWFFVDELSHEEDGEIFDGRRGFSSTYPDVVRLGSYIFGSIIIIGSAVRGFINRRRGNGWLFSSVRYSIGTGQFIVITGNDISITSMMGRPHPSPLLTNASSAIYSFVGST